MSGEKILADKDFWSWLEYTGSNWLSSQKKKEFRRFWIDGFLQDRIAKRTKKAVQFEGMAWLMETENEEGKQTRSGEYKFQLRISSPAMRLKEFSPENVASIALDHEKRLIQIELS